MKFVFLLLLAIAAAAARCPNQDWTQQGDHCYWISEFKVTWSSVKAVCDSLTGISAKPATIHDGVEETNLAKVLQGKRAWLGLFRPYAIADWIWEDGSQVNFTDWAADEPSENGNCAVINYDTSTSQWGTEECSADHPAVCQTASGCPEGWKEHEGKCYWWSTNSNEIPWEDAAAECQTKDPWYPGQFVSIHSQEQNDFLYSMTTDSSTWIGLSRAESSASWTWADGSNLDFINWKSGEPTRGDCAFLYYTSGEWVSLPCQDTVAFLCQADL